MQLLIDFAQHVLELWKRCFDESYFEPIKDLCALLTFVLQLNTMSVAPHIISYLLPIAQDTIYLIADRRYRSVNGDVGREADAVYLVENIDSTLILALMYHAALACATASSKPSEPNKISMKAEYWKLMTMDSIQLLLTPKQQLDDIIGMLKLLATSAMPASIGPILESKEPAQVAQLVLEKVSKLLTDPPRWAASPRQKHAVRLASLETLVAFLHSPFGATQLALHGRVIPRLVTALSNSIDELYDMNNTEFDLEDSYRSVSFPLRNTFDENDGGDDEEGGGRMDGGQDIPSVYRIISQSMFILHHLVTDAQTGAVANINEKLLASHGGSQRYRLALARLNFAGDLLFEGGIDDETMELAHELLELAVTPDEAEAISEAFGVDED
jgi:Protein of unknown function (DUF3636)